VVSEFLVMISFSFIYTACEYFIHFQIRHVRRSHLCRASSFIEKIYALWSSARTCPYQLGTDRFDSHVEYYLATDNEYYIATDNEYYSDEINTGDEINSIPDSTGFWTR
jgi:hypothetical protein